MRIKGNSGVTLIALIITIIVLVMLAAVSIKSIYDYNLVNEAGEGAIEYSYEQEKEKISQALYQALLDSFLSDSISFNYSAIAGNVKDILEDSGEFTCTLVETVGDYSTYKVTPVGRGFYFELTINNVTGVYTLELGE